MSDEGLSDATASLARVQNYDTSTLPRREDLGRQLSFEEAVPYADKAVTLFRMVPQEVLPQLSRTFRNQVRSSADQFYNILDQIQTFSPSDQGATELRQSYINALQAHWEPWYNALMPAILFATSTQRDFSQLQRDARAASQAATDEATRLTAKLTEHEAEANRVLAEVRKVAAEQGVGFHAAYFKTEADNHDKIALQWRSYTIVAGAAVGIFAVSAMFLYKWSALHPADATEAVQLSLAKIGLFAVLGFALVLCSKTFLAHTHNAIVNRHRQNALLTFQALVNAAKDENKKDIILTHASACMFSPQETGFTKHSAEGTSNIIQLLTKAPGAEKAAS